MACPFNSEVRGKRILKTSVIFEVFSNDWLSVRTGVQNQPRESQDKLEEVLSLQLSLDLSTPPAAHYGNTNTTKYRVSCLTLIITNSADNNKNKR